MLFMYQNVSGLASSIDALTQAIILHQPDVLCLTETWGSSATPRKWTEMGYQVHTCAATRTQGRHRQGEGIVLLTKPAATRIEVSHNTDMAAIALQMGDTRVIALYIKPAIGKNRYNECLRNIQKWVRGRCIICGDWNARSHWWDKSSNPAGKELEKWVLHGNFTIAAPQDPTFRCSRGSSTVDLLIARGWSPLPPEILHGQWNEKSDHVLIKCTVTQNKRNKSNSFSPSVLANKGKQNIAARFYAVALPPVQARIEGANNAQALQDSVDSLVETLRRPWILMTGTRPPRYRPGWTPSLDKQAKKRSELLKCPSGAGEKIRQIDRDIKRQFRKNKRRLSAHAIREMGCREFRNAADAMKFVTNDAAPQKTIDPDLFTAFLAKQQVHDAQIRTGLFNVPADFKTYLRQALNSSKTGKAPGPDGVYNEMLRLQPKMSVAILLALWIKIGQTGFMPTQLRSGTVVPIYKKGDTTDPQNYRPIMLLSHVRKVISGAIGLFIRANYTPHRNQWGFTPSTSTEDAILAAEDSIHNGHRYLAVLDLKGAYDSVRRDQLLHICQSSLPETVTQMLPPLLEAQVAETKGQQLAACANVSMGVPQGDRPSPDLFNIFMDTLLRALDEIPPSLSTHPANAYADDVLLLARSTSGLQNLLQTATRWSDTHAMKWNVKKCSVLLPSETSTELKLEDTDIPRQVEAEYLGVTITSAGTTDTLNKERTNQALQKFRSIRQKISLPLSARRIIATSYIYPKMTYGLHVTPLTTTHAGLGQKLDDEVLPWVLGVGKRSAIQHLPKMRALLHIPSLHTRRDKILMTRIHTIRKLLSDRPRSILMRLRKTQTLRLLQRQKQAGTIKDPAITEWVNANKGARHIPGIHKNGPQALVASDIPESARHKAILWYLNRFPRRGQERPPGQWLQKWRALLTTENNWSPEQRNKLVQLAEQLQ